MNPKRAKELLPGISKELDLPLELLSDLTEFYWDEIHRDLVSLDYYHIRIPHLGSFHIKGDQKLGESIDKLKKTTPREVPGMSSKKYARRQQNLSQINKMRKLIENYKSQEAEKATIKQLRKDVRAAKEGLEGQS